MRNIESIFREIEDVPDFVGHHIASVSYRNGYGDTPLHIVSNWGDSEAIEVLVTAGADINAKGETGFTPLHCAVEQNKPEAIATLLRLGAKITEQNSNGDTPLDLAKSLGHIDALDLLAGSH